MTISDLYVDVLEQGDMLKRWFPKDGVRRVSSHTRFKHKVNIPIYLISC